MTGSRAITPAIAFLTLWVAAGCAGQESSDSIDYNWDVRPILAENCFTCHGPDSASREADLRLDQPQNEQRQIVAAGRPEASELIRRISSDDPDYRMPPAFSGAQPLSDGEIATLSDWVRQGAVYAPHWAFITPAKPEPPRPASGRGQNEIDGFILSRLEAEDLVPSPEADRETLINRVTLSLTGLPPTLGEVDAFIADESPAAYETLVDRLLTSPAYGEHMAGYWMNIARYSESDGFLDDHHDRLFWPYRDWVISAFNRNMPFDEFGTWQIAGDLLPDATREQRLATAFLRVGKRTTENGAIDEEYRVEYALDRANTIGVGFLALTTGCARCHDHKYDPISQNDYYALTGFFNSADEPGFHAPGFTTIQGGPTLPWTDPATDAQIEAARARIDSAERELAAATLEARSHALAMIEAWDTPEDAAIVAIQDSIDAATVAHYPFDTVAAVPDDALPVPYPTVEPPPGLLSPYRRTAGPPPGAANDASNPAFRNLPRRLPNSLIREKILASPAGMPDVAPAFLEEADLRPGRIGNALFFNETNRGMLGPYVGYYDRTQPFSFDLWIYAASEYEDSQVLNHRDDDNSGGAGYKLSLEHNRLSFYMMRSWPYNMLHVVSEDPVPVGEWTHVALTYDGSSRASGVTLYLNGQPARTQVKHDQLTMSVLPRLIGRVFNEFVGVEFGRRFREVTLEDGAIDEIYFFDRELTPIEVNYLHDGARVLSGGVDTLRAGVAELLAVHDSDVMEASRALYEAREAENEIVSWLPEVMVMADAPEPRETYVLDRGLYNQRLEPVDPSGLSEIFPFDPELPRNRIGLSRWLFDPANPLVSRVFVNRVWQMHFGKGIVETAGDFGMQGSLPTHPELLDWLAMDFVESDWDIKELHRKIVLSATFRQASETSPALLETDPENLLHARGPRRRMSAEQIRDHALAVSGLLVETVGGPSVYPYQPEGIWVPGVTQYDYPEADAVPPEHHHRRSLYTFVKRNTPPPSMSVFDFSERHATIPRRLTSNTPLQALVLLNDPQYLEAYRVVATRVLHEAAGPDAQISRVFRLATRRRPTDEESGTLRAYYDSEYLRFSQDRSAAEAVVSVGVTPVDSTVDVREMAAMMHVVTAVMNTPDAYSIH